jgi:hypothetical protein
MEYEYDPNDTLFDIANAFGITVSELARINNLPEPIVIRPWRVMPFGKTILVPKVYSGGSVYVEKEDIFNQDIYTPYSNRYYEPFKYDIGWWSQGKCYIDIEYTRYYFPCYPESYTDNHSVSVNAQNILGRSEPFQIYSNTGPRTVNVSFKMHREMNHITPIDTLVAAIQSAIYPREEGSLPPRVKLTLGNNCYIEGLIPSGVDVTWSEVINKNSQYNMVDLSFSVVECTGVPKLMGDVLDRKAR